MCCAGSVEVAARGAPAFLITQGERFTAKGNTPLIIRYHAGPRNEWLADTGIAVIAFLPGPHD